LPNGDSGLGVSASCSATDGVAVDFESGADPLGLYGWFTTDRTPTPTLLAHDDQPLTGKSLIFHAIARFPGFMPGQSGPYDYGIFDIQAELMAGFGCWIAGAVSPSTTTTASD
jgi:hypothetical protein